MFQMRLLYYEHNEEDLVVENIVINCSHYHIKNCLCLKDKTVEEIITQFVLNIVLHDVGLSWIIISKKKIKY